MGHPPWSQEGLSICAGTKCPPPCSIGLIEIEFEYMTRINLLYKPFIAVVDNFSVIEIIEALL